MFVAVTRGSTLIGLLRFLIDAARLLRKLRCQRHRLIRNVKLLSLSTKEALFSSQVFRSWSFTVFDFSWKISISIQLLPENCLFSVRSTAYLVILIYTDERTVLIRIERLFVILKPTPI